MKVLSKWYSPISVRIRPMAVRMLSSSAMISSSLSSFLSILLKDLGSPLKDLGDDAEVRIPYLLYGVFPVFHAKIVRLCGGTIAYPLSGL